MTEKKNCGKTCTKNAEKQGARAKKTQKTEKNCD